MTYAELTRKLRALGCVFKRQAKGSHEIWHNPRVNRSTVIAGLLAPDPRPAPGQPRTARLP